jgi:hypothetical protein
LTAPVNPLTAVPVSHRGWSQPAAADHLAGAERPLGLLVGRPGFGLDLVELGEFLVEPLLEVHHGQRALLLSDGGEIVADGGLVHAFRGGDFPLGTAGEVRLGDAAAAGQDDEAGIGVRLASAMPRHGMRFSRGERRTHGISRVVI